MWSLACDPGQDRVEAMTDLIPVPRYGYRAVLILYCGHARSAERYRNARVGAALQHLLFNCMFRCPEGCGYQPSLDLLAPVTGNPADDDVSAWKYG